MKGANRNCAHSMSCRFAITYRSTQGVVFVPFGPLTFAPRSPTDGWFTMVKGNDAIRLCIEALHRLKASMSSPSCSVRRGRIFGGIPPAMYTPPVASARSAALAHSDP